MVDRLPSHVYARDAYNFFRSSLDLSEGNLRNFLVTQAKERCLRNYQEIMNLTTADLDKFRLYLVDVLTTGYVDPDIFNNYFIIRKRP